MADYAKALWVPNSNFFPNTGKKSFLILHATAGGSGAQEIASYFQGTQGTANPVSSHYIVGKDGTVVQTVAEKDGAYGNGIVNDPNWSGNPNDYTISIEHVKSTIDNSEPLTPAQQAASFALIKDICQRNGIGMHDADDITGITGHFAIDPVNRARCPGNFPWQELWNYLQQPQEGTMTIDLTNGTVASHFTANSDNTMWTCKDNGFIVGHAILDFYRSFGGTALCGLTFLGLPLSSEQGVGHPGVVYQRFERGILCYDPGHILDMPPGSGSVYLMHIDSGIGQDPRIAQLQSQITDLQGQITALQAQLAGNTLAQENAALLAKIAQAVKDLQ